MGDMVKIYADDSINVTKGIKSEVYDGIYSLREWLEGRKAAGRLVDSGQDYANALSRLDNMNVFLTNKGYVRLAEAVEKGELRLRDEIVAHFGSKEKVLAFIRKQGEKFGSKNIAFNAKNFVKEPTVFVDMDNFEKNKGHLELRSLSSLIMHEATHDIGFLYSENMASALINKEVNSGVEYDGYKDKGMEAYARLMQMRKDLALSPEEIFSKEDVAKMRQECAQKRNAFLNKQEKGEGETKLAAPKDIDTMIFERYSDEQIQYLLNATSDIAIPEKGAEEKLSRGALASGMKRDYACAFARGRTARQLLGKEEAKTEKMAQPEKKVEKPARNAPSEEIMQHRLAARQYS